MAVRYVTIGQYPDVRIECRGKIAEILQEQANPGTYASPEDVTGCTLEMGTDGFWAGNLGAITANMAQALPTSKLSQTGVTAIINGNVSSWNSGTWVSIGGSISVSTVFYVNSGFTGSVELGTINNPYKTLDSALASVTAATRIEMVPGSYTSAGGTWPAYPISIMGGGSTLTLSGAATVKASYFSLNLNVVGNVVYAGASTDRYYLIGGTSTGNVTLTTGLLHDEGRSLLGGTVTVNGGSLEIISTTITSQIVHTAGQLLIQNTNINATKSTAMITSTATAATDAVGITNSFVTNLGTGTALDLSANTSSLNYLANTNFSTASAASVIGGSSGAIQVADCNYTVTPTGSVFTGTNWGYLGPRVLTGQMTGTNAGNTPGWISIANTSTGRGFYANNTSAGGGFYANNTSAGGGFYANNTSTGQGFYAYNTSAGQGFYAYNASTASGFSANNASTGQGFYAYNASTGQGFSAYNTSTGQGFYANNTSTASGDVAVFDASTSSSTGRALVVKGGEASAWTNISTATTLYKYSNRRIAVTAASTLTIDTTAIAATSEWIITSRNVAVTITTSGSLIYHGAALASSVTIPATQSLIRVVCDGTYVYIY